jgi:hypothetical protein
VRGQISGGFLWKEKDPQVTSLVFSRGCNGIKIDEHHVTSVRNLVDWGIIVILPSMRFLKFFRFLKWFFEQN